MAKKQEKICAGIRQTLHAAKEKRLQKIVLAADADSIFRARVHGIADKHGVPLETGGTAAELGRRAGIEVGTGVIGVLI
jgi:ribosomal protein L7Ae-like RNA K-turn-binding protein